MPPIPAGRLRHTFDAKVCEKDLTGTYLPAFKELADAYNRLNGEACCASYCLIDLLRNQWGFEGYLVSDNGALNDILKAHRLTDTIEDTAPALDRLLCRKALL